MNKNCNVLVLGAGVYQAPLIEAVKKSGFRAIVASVDGDYPGFKLADEIWHIDTRDCEKLLEAATKADIAASVTAGTDVSVPALGLINESLKLAGVSKDTALISSDKVGMKNAFKRTGVNTAAFTVVDCDSSVSDCIEAIEKEVGLPAIMKAVDSSGSRGVLKVFDYDDVEGALSDILDVTRSPQFIIEECLLGIEFGIQLFVNKGQIKLFMPHGDYIYTDGGRAVPFGHYAPYGDNQMKSLALEQSRLLVEALGITEGAINVDAMYCNGEVYILEAGARAGATGLPEMVSELYGIDYYEKIVASALGEDVAIPEKEDGVCVISMLLGANRSGTVAELQMPIEQPPGIKRCNVDFEVGDSIDRFSIGPDRVGLLVAAASSLDEAELRIEAATKEIRCTLSDGALVKWVRCPRQ